MNPIPSEDVSVDLIQVLASLERAGTCYRKSSLKADLQVLKIYHPPFDFLGAADEAVQRYRAGKYADFEHELNGADVRLGYEKLKDRTIKTEFHSDDEIRIPILLIMYR